MGTPESNDNLMTAILESTGCGVINGLTVTAQDIPNMTVRVSAGIAHMPNGRRYTPSEVKSLTITAADSTKPRKDLIYLDSNGVVAYIAGELGTKAAAHSRSYTITTNAAVGDSFRLNLVSIKAVKSGAAMNAFTFNIGATIAETVANLKAFFEAHPAISSLFTITANANVLTVTEKVAGGGAWSQAAAFGTMTLSSGTAIQSRKENAIPPALPIGGVTLASIDVAAGTKKITNAVITNNKIDKNSVFNVLDYGAVGDGVHNDTDAFLAASDAINKADGGVLYIPHGTYIVGKQTFAGKPGLKYAYKPSNIIYIQNCNKNVIIEGNGAILKAADGLRFGAFDPTTGEVYNPASMPFVLDDYRADAYYGMIFSVLNKSFVIRDLELDGNIFNLNIGGVWGDTGRQTDAYGINCRNTDKITIINVNSHHHALDGIISRHSGLAEKDGIKPFFLINVSSEYNARGAFSWSGGNGLVALNCKFNHTGKALFYSEPGSGVCLEVENEENNIIRNGLFINCEIINNYNYGFLVTSGDMADVKLIGCTIWGTTAYSLRVEQPNFVFEDCKIYGTFDYVYGNANPNKATKFYRCVFEDKLHPDYGYRAVGYNVLISGDNVLFDGCTFIGNNGYPIVTERSDRKEIFKNCHFIIRNGLRLDRKEQARFAGSYLENCTFTEEVTTPPKTAWYISISDVTYDNVYVNCKYTKWGNYTGATGYIGSNVPKPSQYLAVQSEESLTTANGYQRIGNASSLPTTGTYNKADVLFKHDPVVGSELGWVCITSGTQGTLNNGLTTGSISSGSTAITVSSLTGLEVGNYISIAGVTGVKCVKKIPLALANTTVDVEVASGQTVLPITVTTNFAAGNTIAIGRGTSNYETAEIFSIQSGVSLTLRASLTKNHRIGETVTNCVVIDSSAAVTVADALVSYSPATFTTWGIVGNSHIHTGEDITTGTISTARLGTGTANSKVYLRGDGTWNTPIQSKTPANATDTGNVGEICWDANYIYVCVANNTWKRTALSSW